MFEAVKLFEDVPDEENDYNMVTSMCVNMAKAHIFEYLPKIREWFEKGMIDQMVAGEYSDYVDIAFEKSYDDGIFVKKDFVLEKELHKWYEVEGWTNKKGNINKDFSKVSLEKMVSEAYDMLDNPFKHVGRNDPCPCGSGKKFKKCHLLKMDALEKMDNGIEKNKDRDKHLMHYPPLSFDPGTMENREDFQREEGRVYLEDMYDRESIVIDYYVYLAFKQDVKGWFDTRSAKEKAEKGRIKAGYLEKAKKLYDEKVKKENISSAVDYDKKYSIHYFTDEWLEKC